MADWESIDELASYLEGSDVWPPPREQAVRSKIRVWQAFYNADTEYLKKYVGWTHDHTYMVDPLARRISEAFADLTFGTDPVFAAAGHGEHDAEGRDMEMPDQPLLMDIVEENDLPSELQRAEGIRSSEGEVWWRIMVDPTEKLVPVIEWHSRMDVIPLLRGKTVMAAAFISELSDYVDKKSEVVWRHIEYQADGAVLNCLYKGTREKLGKEHPLEAHEDTAELAEEGDGLWTHELDGMLCGRVVNGFGRHMYCGRSDYESVEDMLLSLNEATSVGHSNMRLTAKRRVIIPDTYLDAKGKTPLDDDVFIRSEAHRDPDKPDAGFAQLEWTFDAEPLLNYMRDLTQRIVTRVGLTAHFADANTEDGGPLSGTALRLRMLPASRTSEGKARWWDDALPKILMTAALIDSLEEGAGGFGREWEKPELVPTVTRSDPFPRDQVEDATMVTTLQASKLISKRTSLKILFPEWTEERLEEELELIAAEEAEAIAQAQEAFGGGGGGFAEPPEVPLEETGETG